MAEEKSAVPCEYCGPVCYGGACHNARVEAGDKWGKLPRETMFFVHEDNRHRIWREARASELFQAFGLAYNPAKQPFPCTHPVSYGQQDECSGPCMLSEGHSGNHAYKLPDGRVVEHVQPGSIPTASVAPTYDLKEGERLAKAATPGPWEPHYFVSSHRLGSPACKESCEANKEIPLRVWYGDSTDRLALEYGTTEMHEMQGAFIDSLIAASGVAILDDCGEFSQRDAAFIAYHSPDRIQALIERVREAEIKVACSVRGPEFYSYRQGAISDARLEGMIDETRWWKNPGDEVYEVVRELRDARLKLALAEQSLQAEREKVAELTRQHALIKLASKGSIIEAQKAGEA